MCSAPIKVEPEMSVHVFAQQLPWDKHLILAGVDSTAIEQSKQPLTTEREMLRQIAPRFDLRQNHSWLNLSIRCRGRFVLLSGLSFRLIPDIVLCIICLPSPSNCLENDFS